MIENFEGIFSIEPMPEFVIVTDSVNIESQIQTKKPMGDKVYPIVGVLDSGISDIEYLNHGLKENTIHIRTNI